MVLTKGQKVKLVDVCNSFKLSADISIPIKSGEEIDIACFGVDENNKLSDERYFVFYNQPESPNQEIKKISVGGSERFTIDIPSLPSTIKKLVFTATLEKGTIKESIGNSHVKFYENETLFAEFPFDASSFQNEKAIILCEIYEKAGVWRLSTVANGFNGGLSALLQFFGGEEEKSSANENQSSVIPSNPTKENVVLDAKKIEPPQVEISKQTPTNTIPISLNKTGDTHKIDLEKHSGKISVNLNWNQTKQKGFFSAKGIDLDLGCMYALKSGQIGVIQPLGNCFGSDQALPFIKLDQDDRTGQNILGENLYIVKPDLVEFMIIFALIYEGAPNWQTAQGVVTLKQEGSPDIIIQMDSKNTKDRFCVVAALKNNNGHMDITREERHFLGHKEADEYYGFGFNWKMGRK